MFTVVVFFLYFFCRKCYDDKVYVVPRNYNVSLCSEKCEKTTCGVVVIPESHLKVDILYVYKAFIS